MALRSDDDRKDGKDRKDPKDRKDDEQNLEQIEYLLYQSTQGFHLAFDHADIARVLKNPTQEEKFFTLANMGKVQELLSKFIEKSTLSEKRCYLDSLDPATYELLIRAYFHLVENTILANMTHSH